VSWRRDLATFLLVLPAVALVPTLFPEATGDWRQALVIFVYLTAAAAVARGIVWLVARAVHRGTVGRRRIC